MNIAQILESCFPKVLCNVIADFLRLCDGCGNTETQESLHYDESSFQLECDHALRTLHFCSVNCKMLHNVNACDTCPTLARSLTCSEKKCIECNKIVCHHCLWRCGRCMRTDCWLWIRGIPCDCENSDCVQDFKLFQRGYSEPMICPLCRVRDAICGECSHDLWDTSRLSNCPIEPRNIFNVESNERDIYGFSNRLYNPKKRKAEGKKKK